MDNLEIFQLADPLLCILQHDFEIDYISVMATAKKTICKARALSKF